MSAPLAPVDPYASAQHFFGAELRRLRMRSGLSQRALADLIHVHPTMIGKVETARRILTRDLAARCDGILDADGLLTRLHGLVTSERASLLSWPTPVGDPADLATILAQLVAAGLVIRVPSRTPTAWIRKAGGRQPEPRESRTA